MTADPLGVRAASAAILAGARDVALGDLDGLVAALLERPVPAWDTRHHHTGEHLVEYLLVLDTVNFSFWTRPEDGERRAGGYFQLAERLREVFVPQRLWETERLAAVTEEDLASWLGPFPMLAERTAALRELGALGEPLPSLVQPTAAATARGLAERLPSYRDVPFFKRAQILPADLCGAGVARFPDLAELTCFADYKLPQVLRHEGALVYSERLARMVDGWVELAPGSAEEVQIRAATVVAVDALRDRLAERGRPLMAIEVDWMLWERSQALFPVRPYHRTRTVYY